MGVGRVNILYNCNKIIERSWSQTEQWGFGVHVTFITIFHTIYYFNQCTEFHLLVYICYTVDQILIVVIW